MPQLNPYSNWLFGTDTQPTMIEIDQDKFVTTHPVPMNIHMRQYQGIVKISYNAIVFCGGVNSARLRVSKKCIIYDMQNQVVSRVGNLEIRRYNFGAIYHGVIDFFWLKNIGENFCTWWTESGN